jgi:hypothetical protein
VSKKGVVLHVLKHYGSFVYMFYLMFCQFVFEDSRLDKGTVKYYTNCANTYTSTVKSNAPMTKITDLYNQYKVPT